MKAYKDFFGIKLTKYEVVQAVIHTVRLRNPSPVILQRMMHVGLFKARQLARVLADAQVTSPLDVSPRWVYLSEDAALNAALRQLKKGHE